MTLLALILFTAVSFADDCPVGNLKACQEHLKKEYAKNDIADFAANFDKICAVNPKFSCIKIIVRGDMAEEKKEQLKKRGSKANFFEVTKSGETYLYVLTEKTGK